MLHENLARIRKEKGWTQEDLAKQMHVVRQTISKWEKGKVVPDALTVQKLAEVLDVSVSTLYGENQKEKPKKLWKIAGLIFVILFTGLLFHQKRLPSSIEVSNIYFQKENNTITCSFVPSTSDKAFDYILVLTNSEIQLESLCDNKNGTYSTSFDAQSLQEQTNYSIYLQISN